MGRYDRVLGAPAQPKAQPNQGSLFAPEPAASLDDSWRAGIAAKEYTDPRPDLAEDSWLWAQFLQMADQIDPNFAGALHGMRCMGTRIRRGEKGGYVIRPDIDPTGNRGWRSMAEYEAERDRWLQPYRQQVVQMLGKLFEWGGG